jgi:putative membrane-bound dehydrogenase-like protein
MGMGNRVFAIAVVVAATMAAAQEAPPPDQRSRVEQGAPLPLDKSAAAMTVADGFHVSLFAGEPDVHQPIGFCIDHRGRLWVAENDAFPQWQSQAGRDRVVIFEDADGDGRFDRRTVFVDGLNYVTSVQIGAGGVWVMDCPRLVFYPLQGDSDRPAGAPEVVLDGFGAKGIHNLPNSMTWGPDGWLYGCNGTIFDVEIGPPGAPAERRTKMNRGVWRYHPRTRVFERVCEGTANPWGLDYDEHGQMFMSNNVVAHLWHVIPGGCYPRIWGEDFNKHSYVKIETIADHLHWGGGDWKDSRGGEGAHGLAGGGHSHAGCMLYYGESFPGEYRGSVFMCNTHGHRVNNDALERKGSGFVARHRPDFLLANDKWFKGVSAQYGPDGSVYVIDWSDTGECHDYDVTDRAHGRIYRIAYDGTKGVRIDLTNEPDRRLVEMQTWRNEWYARHARTVLRERGLQGPVRAALRRMMEESADPVHRLRAMWTLHQCGGVDEPQLIKALGDGDEYVRGWAIQLIVEDKKSSQAALEGFEKLAGEDPSPVVRLYLASAMQRLTIEQRRPILEALISHAEDGGDPNLPQMYWYALEPVVAADRKAAAGLLGRAKIAKLRELIARRLAAG